MVEFGFAVELTRKLKSAVNAMTKRQRQELVTVKARTTRPTRPADQKLRDIEVEIEGCDALACSERE